MDFDHIGARCSHCNRQDFCHSLVLPVNLNFARNMRQVLSTTALSKKSALKSVLNPNPNPNLNPNPK